jgi:hypothetical protein
MKVAVWWDEVPCSLVENEQYFEGTSFIFCQATQLHIPEDSNLTLTFV